MKLRSRSWMLAALLTVLVAATPAFAADITGTVTNKTTGKPAAGDDVILLKLSQGMQEVGRTRTDARGEYKLTPPEEGATYLIRVNHRNVNYHQPAPAGTSRVDIDVFDAAESLPEVAQTIDVMRVEADGGSMRVIEMFAVNNTSNPPRTQMNAKNFEVALPAGAQIEQAMAAGPGGMPVSSSPIPTGEKDHYAFLFPLRPGETRFQISYTVPYSGSARITPQLLRPTENFAVSVPKSMDITPAEGSRLTPRGEDAGMKVFVAGNVKPGDPLAFTVSGTGTVPLDNVAQSSDAGAGAEGGGPPAANRPGGGMANPINTPDPLFKYRWWIIAGVALVLVAGAAFSMARPSSAATASEAHVSGGTSAHVPTHGSIATRDMMAVLKDELFALETQRAGNAISDGEYQQVKSALELLLRRELSRRGTSPRSF